MKINKRRKYYEVQTIVASRVDKQGQKQYLVKWQDWSKKFNTWEPINNLKSVEYMIKKFQKKMAKSIHHQNNEVKLTQNGQKKRIRRTQHEKQMQNFKYDQKSNNIRLVNNVLGQVKCGRPTQQLRQVLKNLRTLYQINKNSNLKDYEPLLIKMNRKSKENSPTEDGLNMKEQNPQKKEKNKRKLIKKQKKIGIKNIQKDIIEDKPAQSHAQNHKNDEKECQMAEKVGHQSEGQSRGGAAVFQNQAQIQNNQDQLQLQIQENLAIQSSLSQNNSIEIQQQPLEGLNSIIQDIKDGKDIEDIQFGFRDNHYFFKFRYFAQGSQESIEISSKQIAAINPHWIIQYYENILPR